MTAKDHKTLADGTPCIVCKKCGRYGSTANWNKVNAINTEPPPPIAVY